VDSSKDLNRDVVRHTFLDGKECDVSDRCCSTSLLHCSYRIILVCFATFFGLPQLVYSAFGQTLAVAFITLLFATLELVRNLLQFIPS